MNIKVLIIEDEMLVAEDIATDLADFGFEVVDMLISGEECIRNFESLAPDVVIMDLQIKGPFDGVETAKRLNERWTVPVIYLTANSDKQTLDRVLNTFPAPFITKPYNRNDLIVAIELAFSTHNNKRPGQAEKQKENDAVFIKSGQQYKKVKLEQILYLEASGSYVHVHTTEGEYLVSYNLSHAENILGDRLFKRIHRSFLVNITHIDAIEQGSVIVNKKALPVSKAYHRDLMSVIKKL